MTKEPEVMKLIDIVSNISKDNKRRIAAALKNDTLHATLSELRYEAHRRMSEQEHQFFKVDRACVALDRMNDRVAAVQARASIQPEPVEPPPLVP